MAERAVMQRRLMAMSGIGLAAALALWAWWLPPTTRSSSGQRQGEREGGSASQRAHPPPSSGRTPSTPATPDWRTPVPSSVPPFATTGFAVPITVAAPQKLLVGEMNELVVGVGANAGINEVSFTVQFDADVLQVRAGTEGSWAEDAGAQRTFRGRDLRRRKTAYRFAAPCRASGQASPAAPSPSCNSRPLRPGTTSVRDHRRRGQGPGGEVDGVCSLGIESANDGGLRATAAARGAAPGQRRRGGTAYREHRRRRLRPNAIQRRQLRLRFRNRRHFRR